MFDLKIVNGLVIDGTGAPARRADVGIVGETIAAVGDLAAAPSRQTIDASRPSLAAGVTSSTSTPPAPGSGVAIRHLTSAFVAPGFIDAHSHSDVYVLVQPDAPSKIRQGVTTEIVGNCGASAVPRVGRYELPTDWADVAPSAPCRTVAEYRERVGEARPALNVALLIGHGTLRAGVVGYANVRATAADQAEMRRLLEQGLDEGARGLSSGLIYRPGMFASREELTDLAAVAGRRGGLYSSHMRSEGTRLLEALEEALAIGRGSGARVQISHLKTSKPPNWGKLDAALGLIRTARAEGLAVFADRYPYTASWTGLDAIFPAWAQEGDNATALARLRAPDTRRRLREELLRNLRAEDWAGLVIGGTAHPDNRRFQGWRLVDVAAALGLAPVDAALHLIDTDELRTAAFFGWMNEDNMLRVLAEPYVMLGSDASIRDLTGPLSRDFSHPRAFGTFPCFLQLALAGRTVPLEEAVRKMTSLPAAQYGLAGRGVLAPGAAADVVVFEPTVRDVATYADPHRFPEGITEVVVNGALTFTAGAPTGARAGRFL